MYLVDYAQRIEQICFAGPWRATTNIDTGHSSIWAQNDRAASDTDLIGIVPDPQSRNNCDAVVHRFMRQILVQNEIHRTGHSIDGKAHLEWIHEP